MIRMPREIVSRVEPGRADPRRHEIAAAVHDLCPTVIPVKRSETSHKPVAVLTSLACGGIFATAGNRASRSTCLDRSRAQAQRVGKSQQKVSAARLAPGLEEGSENASREPPGAQSAWGIVQEIGSRDTGMRGEARNAPACRSLRRCNSKANIRQARPRIIDQALMAAREAPHSASRCGDGVHRCAPSGDRSVAPERRQTSHRRISPRLLREPEG